MASNQKQSTYTVPLNNKPSVYRTTRPWERDARLSFGDKTAIKKHGGHSIVGSSTMSSVHLFAAQKHAYKIDIDGNNPTVTNTSFSPRTTNVYKNKKSTHYTPDWFKMSIRTVDRDNVHKTDDETKMVAVKIKEVCALRDKWLYEPSNGDDAGCSFGHNQLSQLFADLNKSKKNLPPSIASQYSFEFKKGIMHLTSKSTKQEAFEEYTFDEYLYDLRKVTELVSNGPAKTMCYRRLKILQSRFVLHLWLNDHIEVCEVKSIPHRDFYNVRKIDNHVHHSACMHQKHLLRFIKGKIDTEPNTIVYIDKKTKKKQSLIEVFKDIGLTAQQLSIDSLDMHAHQETFQRFDKFNAKYNPIGKAQLRTIFLKIDNHIKGRFLAEITKEVSLDLENGKYQYAEYRLSIYGKKKQEWDILSNWICNNKLYSENVRWLIQMPRIYNIFKKIGIPSIKTFNDMLSNFFTPLFEVTINPSSHPNLHFFLQIIVGFDSVDDESSPEQKRRRYPDPEQWTMNENPPYIYYMYYTYINILKLNKLREERGFNTFAFRPHCGEAGGFDHLASCFLLAQSINHGIVLKQAPVLQYLYYLKQIGLAMSPLSNNILFKEYDQNPLPTFFKRGLNVSLSTDDPLLIHYTKDALLEEYSIAAQVYNLSSIDLCELAYNSVKQCGFDKSFKQHCIGFNYNLRGSAGNDIYQSNVPDARRDFRASLLKEEENFVLFAGYPTRMLRAHSMGSFLKHNPNDPNASHSHQAPSMNDGTSVEYLSGFPNSKLTPDQSPYNGSLASDDAKDNVFNNLDLNPDNQIQKSVIDIVTKEQSFLIRKHSNSLKLAQQLASSINADINSKPPHSEWLSLAQEKRRLEIIRDELNKFVEKNKNNDNDNNDNDMDAIKQMITTHDHLTSKMLPLLHQSNTSIQSISKTDLQTVQIDNDEPTLFKIASGHGSTPINDPTQKEKQKQNKKYLKDKNASKKGKNKKDSQFIDDIRGIYFDENDELNVIDNSFNITFGSTNIKLQMKSGHKNIKKQTADDKNIFKLKCDLSESKQEYLLDEPIITDLLPSDQQQLITCHVDVISGELIWNSGSVWFKKEWNVLTGAWEDTQNNLIEITTNNKLRYISGYGPFNGEFIGFKKLRIKMPNNKYIVAELLSGQELKWENGEHWERCTDKGCLLM